ncbi:MAG: F-box protein [Verrucomicrobia bacterium]|nr:F-box protein [Verrucomicrobiota bacterium]
MALKVNPAVSQEWKGFFGRDKDLIPLDVIMLIFRRLKALDLGRCAAVCRQWHALANGQQLWDALNDRVISKAFNKKKWEKYCGKIDDPLPLLRSFH